jgi:hypothetical protein
VSISKIPGDNSSFPQHSSDIPNTSEFSTLSSIVATNLVGSEPTQHKLTDRKIQLLKPSSTPLLKKIWKALCYYFSTIIKIVAPFFAVNYEHRKTEKYRQYSEGILYGFQATDSQMYGLNLNPIYKDVDNKLKQAHSFLNANLNIDNKPDCRSNFKSFLEILRLVMNTDAYKNDPYIKMMADRYCFAMYVNVDIRPYTRELVPNATKINPKDLPLNFVEQLETFSDIYDSISLATHLINPWDYGGQSIRGHWTESLGLDPNMQGGPPYRKFTLQFNGKTAVNIRIPTPTIGIKINSEC